MKDDFSKRDVGPCSSVSDDGKMEGFAAATSQSIEWYHEGQSRLVSVNGIDVVIRLVTRKNRKARIAIEAPAGALFRSLEPKRANLQ